ncbi:MAG TPA: hypothetical protein VEP90_15785 [Methylomirabilota bacterium]|nr:hypothetical protein [Methylomirabilota bacterium]
MTTDKTLLETIQINGFEPDELYRIANWHEDIANDKMFHKQIALAHNQSYIEKDDYPKRKERHLQIAKALRDRAVATRYVKRV